MKKRIEHKLIDGIEYKRCNTCKSWKFLGEFYDNKNNWDNLHTCCKKCSKEYDVANKEHKAEYDKKRRSIKKEDIARYSRQYHVAHADEIRVRKKAEYFKKKDQIAVRKKRQSVKPVLFSDYASRLVGIEEVRESSEALLEVKCAYCGRWLQPTNSSVRNRLTAIITVGAGEHRFYCSGSCKMSCPTYGQRKYPKSFKKATSREVVPLLRQLVLERDNYTCQKCGATTETAQLHVHHEKSYMLNKMMANDPDNCITFCKDCHKKVHSQDGCRYIDLKC